jgi:hypothetical protein
MYVPGVSGVNARLPKSASETSESPAEGVIWSLAAADPEPAVNATVPFAPPLSVPMAAPAVPNVRLPFVNAEAAGFEVKAAYRVIVSPTSDTSVVSTTTPTAWLAVATSSRCVIETFVDAPAS